MAKTFDDFLKGSTQTFNAETIAQVQKHADAAAKALNDHFGADPHKGMWEYKICVECKPGQKYARLVRSEVHKQTGVETGRQAYGFAGADGKLYKAKGWTAPAKNFNRGDWFEMDDLGGGRWQVTGIF